MSLNCVGFLYKLWFTLLGDFDTKIRLLRGNKQTTIGEKMTKVLKRAFWNFNQEVLSFYKSLQKTKIKDFILTFFLISNKYRPLFRLQSCSIWSSRRHLSKAWALTNECGKFALISWLHTMSPPIVQDAFSEGLVANNWGIHGTYYCGLLMVLGALIDGAMKGSIDAGKGLV